MLGQLEVEVLSASTDKPVAGVRVTLLDKARTQAAQTATTDEQGKARFEKLLIGDYSVQLDHADYEQQEYDVRVSADATAQFQALLIARGSETVVRVSGERVLVNPKSSASSTRRDRDDIEVEIANSESMQAVVSTVPGVQANSVGQIHARGEHKSVAVSIDGVDVPIPTASQTSQLIDPRFLDQIDVQTGGFDASNGGQTGALLNMVTRRQKFAEASVRGGNAGQFEAMIRAGDTTADGHFDYFVGARTGRTDLRVEPPHPDQQSLNNYGLDSSLLLRLHGKTEKDDVGLTFSYQHGELGVPQTPQNFAAGVRQEQFDRNALAVLSWRHQISEPGELHLGLAYLNSAQDVNHNGIFTPWTSVDPLVQEELAEEGFPADPENPGSPYLPTTRLNIQQFQPSVEYTHRLGDDHRVKVGVTADFIHSDQYVDVVDAGGGGQLPSLDPALPAPARFTARVIRDGFFGGIYASHTVPLSDQLTLNYGLRADRFHDGFTVNTGQISPTANLAWSPTRNQVFRVSYNRLFQPPPLELDVSGQTTVVPQRTHLYEVSYENQFVKNLVGKLALVRKDFTDPIDIALLVPNSNFPVYAPVNFGKGRYQGVELSLKSENPAGWNGFVTATLSEARPLVPGQFTTHFPSFFDHDQRAQLTWGLSHRWEEGWFASTDWFYGSGYPQEALPLYNSIGLTPFGFTGERVPRLIANLSIGYRPRDEKGQPVSGPGFSLDVLNVFDDRSLVNFFSEFSGTRFVQGRRVLFNASLQW